MPLQEATDARKKKRSRLRYKIFERQSTGKTNGSRTIQPKKHRNFNPKTEVKCQVQSCVDKIIVIIEARKQDVLMQSVIKRQNHWNLSHRKKTK